jgi:Trypsin
MYFHLLLAVVSVALAPLAAHAISGSYNSNGTPVDTRIYPLAFDSANGNFSGYSGVVQLLGSQYACSGVAISPTAILTAAHCVDSNRAAIYSVLKDNGAGVVTRETGERGIASFTAYPTFNTSSSVVQANDIGVVTLASPLPDYIESYRIAYSRTLQYTGGVVAVAGYGLAMSGNDTTTTRSVVAGESLLSSIFGSNVYVPQLRGGLNIIDSYKNGGTVFMTDFDASANTPLQSREAGTTQGDSGSGVFHNSDTSAALHCKLSPASKFCSNGAPIVSQKLTVPASNVVIGITSFSSYSGGCGPSDYACWNRFGTSDGYTAVGPYLDWIRSIAGNNIASFDIDSPIAAAFASADFSNGFDTSEYFIEPLLQTPLVTVPIGSSSYLVALGCMGIFCKSFFRHKKHVLV